VIEKKAFVGVSEKKETDAPKGTERLMLVDDEIAILDTLKKILTRQGYRVSTFANGESALQAFKKNPHQFDLIITDMTMPQMTGDTFSRKALQIRASIPIIICTGYHENFTEQHAMNAGIKKYIQKPVLGMDLSKIVRNLLDIEKNTLS
jgi:DNA-binding NtrC family response regulator